MQRKFSAPWVLLALASAGFALPHEAFCQTNVTPRRTLRCEPSQCAVSSGMAVALEVGVGALATAIVVPSMLAAGAQLQGLTGDLVGSLFVSAVPYLIVVPTAITGLQSLLVGTLRPHANYGGWAAFATTLASVGLLVAGHGMGVSPLNGDSVLAFTALNVAVLPGLSAVVMYLASPRPCDRSGEPGPGDRSAQLRPRIVPGGLPMRNALGQWHFPLLGGTF